VADSLRKRYFFKFGANLIGLALSAVTYALIPRGLGPKAYGDFTFLSHFFTEIVNFLDMGTSLCFYTKLSQRPRELGLVQFYLGFSVVVSLAVMGFAALAQPFSLHRWLWPGQQMLYIYLAALWGILMWFNKLLIMMGDAYGLTVSTELGRMAQKVMGCIVIFMLFWSQQLQLANLFFYQYVVLIFLIVFILWVIRKAGYSLKWGIINSIKQVKTYFKEFYEYSHPLFTYSLAGLVVGLLDRWLLQYFAGSVQQGFWGLSYQIGAFCFLFTGAMTPLLTREYAIAFGKNDLEQMSYLFRRYTPVFYSLAAYFACFVAVQADSVIYLTGGKNFSGAYPAVAIMAFYPIHQTYGQLSGSIFYATGQTALYRNIGIIFMLLGLPLTYFLVAPPDRHGLDAGAMGLAGKMVFLQFIAVNVQLYFNTLLLKLRFWHYVGHQLLCVGSMLSVAIIVSWGVDKFVAGPAMVIQRFLLAGILYTLLVVILTYLHPVIFGLNREDLHFLIKIARQRFRLTQAGAGPA
jgi:O-antigen/teichoic acid export membrane protein